ncbi:MAG: hypothetical protein EOO00_03045 [Chitinophagaceae bacterium]|nr:MAG: hypothetical protein EOO00_03045 [Chitinophagaceae bacterium]
MSVNIFASFTKSTFATKLIDFALFIWLLTAGIRAYIFAVMVLTVIDVITGIIASVKKGEPFKSRVLRKGLLEKVLIYNLLMVSVFILEYIIKKAIGYDNYWLVLMTTTLIGTYELSSIFENLYVINPNLTFLKSLIKLSDKLRDKTISVAEGSIEKLDENISKKTD